MRQLAVAVGVSLVVSLIVPQASAGPSKEEIGEWVKKVEANAKSWIEQDVEDPEVNAALAKIRYDEGNVEDLTAACAAGRKEADLAYVSFKLLYPLAPAGATAAPSPEVARRFLPLFKTLDARLKYQPFPNYSKDNLRQFVIPANFARQVNSSTVSALADIHKRRDEKLAREKPIAKSNKMVHEFRQLYSRVLLAADDPKADAVLVKMVSDYEAQAYDDYLLVCNLIVSKSAGLKPERAKQFFEEVGKIATALRWKTGWYANAVSTVFAADNNTRCAATNYRAGSQIMERINKMAAKAGAQPLAPADGSNLWIDDAKLKAGDAKEQQKWKEKAAKEADFKKAQEFIKLWQKARGPNSMPSDNDITTWLEQQKKKPAK